MARRNQGVYEPEFRILFIGAMLFGVFGYAGWAGTIITFFDGVSSIGTYNSQLVLRTTCLGSEQWPASRSSLSHWMDFDLILYYFQHDKFYHGRFGSRGDHISFGHTRRKCTACLSSDKLFEEHGSLWVYFFRERDGTVQRCRSISFDLGRLSSGLLAFDDSNVPVW